MRRRGVRKAPVDWRPPSDVMLSRAGTASIGGGRLRVTDVQVASNRRLWYHLTKEARRITTLKKTAKVELREQYTCFRPRFTLRSLMIVVAVACLILSLVAYEKRLKGWARYHEARYLEQITPTTRTPSVPGGLTCRARLLDGTWTVLHTKTPLAGRHDHQKWGYKRRIDQTNLLLLASFAGFAFLWLVRRVLWTRIRPGDGSESVGT